MTRADVLRHIKMLRDEINGDPDSTGWVNKVLYHLDQAADVVEFPSRAQACWVATFRALGHEPRPLDESDWRTVAGADPGTLIVWAGPDPDDPSRAYLLTPEGEVKEFMIDGNGNTSEWMWPAKAEVNTEPDFQGS